MKRHEEKGFRLAAMNDPNLIRGIWFRQEGELIEICMGKVGDDDFVALRVGDLVTRDKFYALLGMLQSAAHITEDIARLDLSKTIFCRQCQMPKALDANGNVSVHNAPNGSRCSNSGLPGWVFK